MTKSNKGKNSEGRNREKLFGANLEYIYRRYVKPAFDELYRNKECH
jgi:hypothetical protein